MNEGNVVSLGLDNSWLYEGLEIEMVAGRRNLVTPVDEAINVVGDNINRYVAGVPRDQRAEVVLTGPMAVWSYLVVFHAVVHAFNSVYYDDGRGRYLVSKHGR